MLGTVGTQGDHNVLPWLSWNLDMRGDVSSNDFSNSCEATKVSLTYINIAQGHGHIYTPRKRFTTQCRAKQPSEARVLRKFEVCSEHASDSTRQGK